MNPINFHQLKLLNWYLKIIDMCGVSFYDYDAPLALFNLYCNILSEV